MDGSLPNLQLSIIIVSWNTRVLLAACLASLFHDVDDDRQKKTAPESLPFEILVVDNASTDGSPQMVREQFPMVRLIENQWNVGFARANNQAIAMSKGRYVLLLNPDTEVMPGAVETLVDFLNGHRQAGAAGAKLLNSDGTLQPSCHPLPTLPRELWRMFHLDAIRPYALYQMARWDANTSRQVDVVQGACMMLRREALDQAGLLDEDYFIYSEEVDLCHRLRRHGWHVHWIPQAMVVHHGGQSTCQVAEAMFLRLYQGKVLFFRKHHGRLAAQLYKLILLLAAGARLIITPLAWLEHAPKRQRYFLLANNYRRLIKALPGF